MGIDIVGLIIFAVCIVLFIWDKLPMATTAILGCAVMILFGVCSFSDAFKSFASSTVILTIGVMVIGAAIAETGVAASIGAWIIKVSKGSQTKLIIGTYIVAAVMSAFLTNSAVLAIFIPIIIGLSASSDGKLNAKSLIMPIAFACVLGGTSTLVGSTQQMTAYGLLEESGLQTFKVFDFAPVGGTLAILGLIYCLFIGRKRGEKIWGSRPEAEEDVALNKPTGTTKPTKFKTIAIGIVFVFTVVFYITEWIPLAVTSTIGALACIITGCISQKTAISKVNWNIVGRLAGCLGIANALSVSGGVALIAKGFSSIVGSNISPFILFAVLVLLTQVTSEFMSNSTSILVTLPILITVAPAMGLNVYAYALGMTIASAVGMSCPLASSTLGMSMSVGYKFNDYFKYSIFFDIIGYIVVLVMIPLIYGLTV